VDTRKTPPMALPNFPYKGRFTAEQLADAMDRKDRIIETLMDPVGPDGTLINVPVDMMHILAFHQALAGVDVHTDHRQLIESRSCVDKSEMFEMYEWRPRGDFGDTPPGADPAGEAAAVASQMRSQLTPQVRAAVMEILAEEARAATEATTVSRRESAEAVIIEQREMRQEETS